MNGNLLFAVGGLGALAATLFCLIHRRTRLLGVVFAVFLLLGLGVYDFLKAPTPTPPDLTSRPVEPDAGGASVWSSGVAAELDADVYPTAREAVEALASRVAKRARLVSGNPDGPPSLVLRATSRPDLASAFEGELSRLMPATEISREEKPAGTAATNTVEFTFAPQKAGQLHSGSEMESGTCEARLRLGDANTLHRVDCVGKPWVSNFAAFANQYPHRSLIRVRSSSACTSEEQAHQEAMRQAVQRLRALLTPRTGWSGSAGDGLTLADVEQHFGIVDRFTQSFDGISGKIWREALIVDVSREKVASYHARHDGRRRTARGRWAYRFIGGAGVLVAIALLYLLLDAVTLGYYRFAVRTVLIVLLVGAFVLLMVLI